MKKLIGASLGLVLMNACREETNPYKDRYVDQAKAGTEESGNSSESAATASGPASTASKGDAGAPAAATTADTKTVADIEAIPKETASGAMLVCKSEASLPEFKAEMAVLCVNGQPTTAFANLLATPYNGTGTPALSKINSVDNAGVSDFVFASSMEIPLPFAQVLPKRSKLGIVNFVEGNATFVGSRIAEIAPTAVNDLGGFENRDDMRITVVVIRINDVRIVQQNFATIKEGSVVVVKNSLKPGAPDNADNPVANILSFMIADGDKTKMVGVTHQQVANQGQHATAETTALAVAKRMAIEGFNALKN